jgi:hypothetical protein
MDHRWKASGLAVLAGIGLLLSGCSTSPLAPGGSSQTGTSGSRGAPPVVSFAPDGSADYVDAPCDSTGSAPADSTPGVLDLLHPNRVSASARIDGSVGGFLRAGRFLVRVPPGAFTGAATVTVTMPDSALMLCDLSISPLSANHFKVPVELVADLSATNLADASTCTMYWYDPTRFVWMNLVGKTRTSGSLVLTNLDHFSKYASGKAGW